MYQEVEKARAFAARTHLNEYSGKPYTHHLDDVYAVLVENGIDNKAILTAAYLHDIIEDTPTTIMELIRMFGDRVTELVFLVTDKEGKNRHEKHMATYPGIADDEDATILKMADRIANARASRGTKLLKMYRKEYSYFKETLFKPNFKYPKMWAELDELLG